MKAGALDDFGERGQLLASTEAVLDYIRYHFRQDQNGQSSLFGSSLQIGKLRLKDSEPLTPQEALAWEKEHLGLYVSAHPLDSYRSVLSSYTPITALGQMQVDQAVTIAGIISKLKKTLTQKNDPMAFFTLQDVSGSIEVLVFPKTMAKTVQFLDVDRVVKVFGKISDKDGERKLIADSIQDLPNDELYHIALSEYEKDKQLVIQVDHLNNPALLQKIKVILENNPGNAPVYLKVGRNGQAQTIRTKTQVRVDNALLESLQALPEIVKIYDNLEENQ